MTETKHIMFETDNYKNCMNTAIWFGKKVPAKRRLYGRGALNFKSEPNSEFGEN